MSLRRVTLLVLAASLVVMASSAWAQDVCQTVPNLIANCGFETGDFTGWVRSGNLGFSGVTNNPTYVWSGTYGAQIGPIGSDGYLTQNIWGNSLTFAYRQDPAYWGLDSTVLQPLGYLGGGLELFSLSFWLYNDGGTPNDFTVLWNGVDVGPSLVDAGAMPFTNESGLLIGNTPEPASLILLGSGLLGAAGIARRKLGI